MFLDFFDGVVAAAIGDEGVREFMQAKREDPAEEDDEHPEPEEPEDDRGHAGEVEDGEAHEADELPVARVLVEVNRGADAEEERDRHRADHQEHGAGDAGEDAAGGIDVALGLDLGRGRMRLLEGAELPVAHPQLAPFPFCRCCESDFSHAEHDRRP